MTRVQELIVSTLKCGTWKIFSIKLKKINAVLHTKSLTKKEIKAY